MAIDGECMHIRWSLRLTENRGFSPNIGGHASGPSAVLALLEYSIPRADSLHSVREFRLVSTEHLACHGIHCGCLASHTGCRPTRLLVAAVRSNVAVAVCNVHCVHRGTAVRRGQFNECFPAQMDSDQGAVPARFAGSVMMGAIYQRNTQSV